MGMLKGEKVMSKGKVVAELDIEQFDSLDAAKMALGSEEKVLALVNTQFATNKKNDVRRLANVSVSDRKAREMAFDRLTSDTEILMELAAIGDAKNPKDPQRCAAREAKIAELMEVIKAEVEATRGTAQPAEGADGPEEA